jgi:hypothetical protein
MAKRKVAATLLAVKRPSNAKLDGCSSMRATGLQHRGLAIKIGRMAISADIFEAEMMEAYRAYERHIVCLEKPPDDFQAALRRLMVKAIHAYETRPEGLRHGIALDRHLTIILSQIDGPRPMCGIYFNLSSPYQSQMSTAAPAGPQ